MSNKTLWILSCLSLNLFFSTSYANDTPLPISRASLLVQPCFACHGDKGVSKGLPIPSLTGLSADKLHETLLSFKRDQRPATLMNRIAKGYSDEDLKLIASYLATLPTVSQ
ncbi:MAG: hypothetical protein RLZZ422_1342 [Pseudomonadota bacterium]|jgi:sulfide dehydrogenase cytochrome subunit